MLHVTLFFIFLSFFSSHASEDNNNINDLESSFFDLFQSEKDTEILTQIFTQELEDFEKNVEFNSSDHPNNSEINDLSPINSNPENFLNEWLDSEPPSTTLEKVQSGIQAPKANPSPLKQEGSTSHPKKSKRQPRKNQTETAGVLSHFKNIVLPHLLPPLDKKENRSLGTSTIKPRKNQTETAGSGVLSQFKNIVLPHLLPPLDKKENQSLDTNTIKCSFCGQLITASTTRTLIKKVSDHVASSHEENVKNVKRSIANNNTSEKNSEASEQAENAQTKTIFTIRCPYADEVNEDDIDTDEPGPPNPLCCNIFNVSEKKVRKFLKKHIALYHPTKPQDLADTQAISVEPLTPTQYDVMLKQKDRNHRRYVVYPRRKILL